MSEIENIPKGWTVATFDDLLDYIQPTKYIVESTEYDDKYKIPVLTAGKSFILGKTNETDGIFENLPVIIFDDFTTATKFVNFPFKVKSSAMKILKPKSNLVDVWYVYYYIQTVRVKVDTHKRYWISNYSKLPILLPPQFEQRCIVSKIEELFSSLDKGIESLKTSQAQLKVYRKSVLKWAFEGKLTEGWRNENTNRPTSEEIQEQIKKEKQVSSTKNNLKLSSTPKLTDQELFDLQIISNEMIWVRLGELLWSVKDGPHYSPKYVEKGVPFISGGNIRPSGIDFENVKYISEELHEELSRRCKPEKGDVLYTKGGTTGIARVNSYNHDFNVWVHVAVLKTIPCINPFYLQYALNSDHCYKQSQKFTHGVGNQDLGLTRLILITLPICSIQEQAQIVQEIETRLSICDKLEETITTSLLQAESLRQSILKKAFEGKLVPQDPNYEPASVLLERIKAEKLLQASFVKKKATKAVRKPIQKNER